MSIESARSFMARMKNDGDFAREVNSCQNFGARWALIRTAGFDFTAEEIHAAQDSLSDAELEQVSGGRKIEWKDIFH